MPRPFSTNEELIRTIEERGHDYEIMGYAPGGKPVVAVSGGGDREPGIVITAGSHAGEHAGVRAAVDLLDAVETDQQIHVIPTRDPVGVDGFAAALAVALGDRPDIESFEDVQSLLEAEAEMLHQQDSFTLAQIGEYGFVNRVPPDLPAPTHAIGMHFLENLEDDAPEIVDRLRGRRVFLPTGLPDVEGTGNFGRTHTMIVDPFGSVKHLNRFFDSAWAPVETRCVRRLMAQREPGLFIDLHEAAASADQFWFTLRRKDGGNTEAWERRIGERVVSAIEEAGGTLASWEDKFGNESPEDSLFTPVDDGLFWLEHRSRESVRLGEPGGLNATDFAADEYGLAFTNETGAYGSFDRRVSQAIRAVEETITGFETFLDRD